MLYNKIIEANELYNDKDSIEKVNEILSIILMINKMEKNKMPEDVDVINLVKEKTKVIEELKNSILNQKIKTIAEEFIKDMKPVLKNRFNIGL